MKEYMYKVLWFDDEINHFELDIDNAFDKKIEIIGFDNAEEGLVELRENHQFYDAIIVDGLFHKKAGQTTEGLNQTAFGEVAKELFKLKNEGVVIPWFIYSGQKSFVKDKNDLVEIFKDTSFAKGRIYDKNIDEDFEELLVDIKKYSGEISTTKIRREYANVFEVCTEQYIGRRAASDLMNLLKGLNDNSQNHFNTIRKIVEDLFIAFHKFQLIPEEFVKPRICLNETSKFLAGQQEKNVQLNRESIIPLIIQNDLRSILVICQPASHRTTTEEQLNQITSSYQLKSLINHLCSTIEWFKGYVDSNPKIENWKRVDTSYDTSNIEGFEGTIEQDKKGNYYCGDFALNYNFTKENFSIGDRIKIIYWSKNNDKRTNEFFSLFATKFEKLK